MATPSTGVGRGMKKGEQRRVGRKPGSPNKATQRNRDIITSAGQPPGQKGPEPLEVIGYRQNFFLKLHQEEMGKGTNADLAKAVEWLNLAGQAAKEAAPYCHPRLHAIALQDMLDRRREQHEQTDPAYDARDVTDYSKLSDEALDRLYRKELEQS